MGPRTRGPPPNKLQNVTEVAIKLTNDHIVVFELQRENLSYLLAPQSGALRRGAYRDFHPILPIQHVHF